MRSTHTLAITGIAEAEHAKISKDLQEAGYEHALLENGTLDMTGIGLVAITEAPPPAASIHPSIAHFIPLFERKQLPPHLAAVSEPFGTLAFKLMRGPANPETTVALRKLLEAKDAAVRAAVIAHASTPDA